MNKLVFKSKKVRQAIRILAFGTGFIVMLSAVFFTLFRIFERITYDSISDLNRDFAIQIDTLTETINSSIVNYGCIHDQGFEYIPEFHGICRVHHHP